VERHASFAGAILIEAAVLDVNRLSAHSCPGALICTTEKANYVLNTLAGLSLPDNSLKEGAPAMRRQPPLFASSSSQQRRGDLSTKSPVSCLVVHDVELVGDAER
jgi:hypothetical protein